MCRGLAWRVLANAPSEWDVQVFVPEVVLVEAIAGYQRRLNEALVGISSWERKHASLLGMTDVTKVVVTTLKESAAAYPTQLRDSLNELHAKILAPPDVDHIELVQRAATRRRPCDDKGDGYRDTLNWLTVLAFTAQHPEDQVVWVSDNSRDFGSGEGSELHEDLMSELVALGAEKRVRWVRTLGDLVLALTTEHTSASSGDLREIQARLREETLRAFIGLQVLAGTTGTQLNPHRCGLPVVTASAKVEAVGDPDALHFTVRGTAAGDETAVEFDLEADTSIQIEVPPGNVPTDINAFLVSVDPTGTTIRATKRLRFRGLITLDRFDRPLDGELMAISAIEDDPGLAQWDIANLRSSLGPLGLLGALPPGAFDILKTPALPPEVLKSFAVPAFPPEVLKSFAVPTLPPEVLKNLKIPVLPSEVLKRIFPNVVWPKPTPPKSADTRAPESGSAEPESSDSADAESMDDDQLNGDVTESEDPDKEDGEGS